MATRSTARHTRHAPSTRTHSLSRTLSRALSLPPAGSETVTAPAAWSSSEGRKMACVRSPEKGCVIGRVLLRSALVHSGFPPRRLPHPVATPPPSPASRAPRRPRRRAAILPLRGPYQSDLDWPRTRRLVPRPPSRTPFYGGVCGCEPKVSGDSRLKFAVAGRPFWLMAFCQDFSQANNKIYPKRKNVGWTSRACGKALKQSGSHFLCERFS